MKGSWRVLILLLAAAGASAGDPVRGEQLAVDCVSCHGDRGAEPIANNPILAGQHEDYLLRSLRTYKNGERANQIMYPLVKDLSDQDLRDLAAYYAAQASDLR